jgi:putative flippase GtrA
VKKLELNSLKGEFSRFIGAGSLVFIADFLLLFVCTELFEINYLVSNVISFSVALVISYLLSIKWVFRYRKLTNVSLEFTMFLLIGLVCLASNEFAMWLLVEFMKIHYLAAKILATGVTFIFSFMLKKILLFREKMQEDSTVR